MFERDFPGRYFVILSFDDHGVTATYYGKKLSHSEFERLDPSKVTYLLCIAHHYQVLAVRSGLHFSLIPIEGGSERIEVVGEYDPPAMYTVVSPALLSGAAGVQPSGGEVAVSWGGMRWGD